MAESGVSGEIDWEHLLDNLLPEAADLSLFDPSLLWELSNTNPSPPDSYSLSIDDIEQLLMEDHNEEEEEEEGQGDKALQSPNDFLSDFLLNSPVESDDASASAQVPDSANNSNSSPSSEEELEHHLPQTEENNGDDDGVDPVTKKRQRQLRNRDAAVRSRERKKMYVKDLEMKSNYLEGECRRLGMLLQCCYAENQALRLSLQNAKPFDVSMTKQESAVLLLESLLLGSLLWFLGIVCLLILPRLHQSTLEAVPPENVDKKKQESLAPRKAESKLFGLQVFQSFMVGKRCKASRSRMKRSSLILEVLV